MEMGTGAKVLESRAEGRLGCLAVSGWKKA